VLNPLSLSHSLSFYRNRAPCSRNPEWLVNPLSVKPMLSPITLSFLTVSIIPSVTESSIERVAMPVRSFKSKCRLYCRPLQRLTYSSFSFPVNVEYVHTQLYSCLHKHLQKWNVPSHLQIVHVELSIVYINVYNVALWDLYSLGKWRQRRSL